MKLCLNSGCKNRFSIGSESDIDSVNIICLQCNKVQYKSTEKVRLILKYFNILILIIFATIIAYYFKDFLGQIPINSGMDKSILVNNKGLISDLNGTFKSLKNKNSINLYKLYETDGKIFFKYKINQNNQYEYQGDLNRVNLHATLNGKEYLFLDDKFYFKFINLSDTTIQYKKNK